jgi:type I restriction enzyme, S subunit
MSNWQTVSDFVIFSTKGITPNYVESSSILVLNQKCIRNGTINYSFAQFTDDTKQIQQSKFVQRGDILINSTGTGTAGRCAFVPDLPNNYKLIVDSHILILRCNSFYEAQCLSYSLFSFEKTLMSFMTGSSGQSELDKIVLLNLKIMMPIKGITQQKIASILSSLDSKIELNNRINAELEAMAKTLYDYWFVQFDFPDKNGKPYKTSGGKMVWSEELKREIPEGWEVQKMAEWLDIDKSGDWGKEETEGNFTKQVICFRGADINGLNGLDELKPPVRWILEKNSFKILKSHDLIIEISGGSPTQSTGRLAFITDATIKRFEHPLICSNFCKPVSIRNKKLLYNFVYYWNSLYDNGVFFGYEGKTSGIKNLLLDSFISSYYTVVPVEKIVTQFYEIMDNIQEKKQTNLAENQKLTELRDWLLPMLMNGQVKLGDEKETTLSIAAEPSVKYGK